MQLIRPSSAKPILPKVGISNGRKKSAQQLTFQQTLKQNHFDTLDRNVKKSQIVESLAMREKQLIILQGKPQQQVEVTQMFQYLNKFALELFEQYGAQEIAILILQWIIEHRSYQEIPIQICQAYNNLGCVYKRQGKTQLALNALENALNIVNMNERMQLSCITYINITAVLCDQKQFEKALKAAQKAQKLGKDEFNPNQIESIRYLALANYNLANVYEAIENFDEALKQYKKSIEYVFTHLGINDQFYSQFQKAYQQAKQKAIVEIHKQQPIMLKKAVEMKKQYNIPTDESLIQVTPQGENKKKSIRKNNFIEDQIINQDSSATIKKKGFETDEEIKEQQKVAFDFSKTKKNSLSIQNKNQLEQIQFEDWQNSEPSDNDIKMSRFSEENPNMKIPQNYINQRLAFYKRNATNQPETVNLLEQEQRIISQIEEQIQREKEMQLKQQKINVDQNENNKINQIQKIQRFLRKKKAAEQKQIHQNIIYQPNKKIIQKIIGYVKGVNAFHSYQLKKQITKQQQFLAIRKAYCQPFEKIGDLMKQLKDTYLFCFSITLDDTFVKFTLIHANNSLEERPIYKFEMDIQTFLTSLALLYQYIDEIECFTIEENDLLYNLKHVYEISKQFLHLNEVEGKYFVRNLCDNQQQFRYYLQTIGVFLQELSYIENNKYFIQGLNNFEYNLIIPQSIQQNISNPPIYLKKLNTVEIVKILKIQSFIKSFIQRQRVQRTIQQQKKKILSSDLITTQNGQYLQIVKSYDFKNEKQYIYIIDQEKKKKSNDLELYEVLLYNMGNLKDNLFDILKIDLETIFIEFTEEAQYWVQKQIDYEKRGGKKLVFKKSKEDYIKLIQRRILIYLQKRRFEISNYHKIKIDQSDNKNIQKEMVVRKVLLYGEDQKMRANLTTMYLETEQVSPNQQFLGWSEYQTIYITSKNLEHAYAFDKITPYRMKLQCPLPRNEINRAASKMIDSTKICKNKKGELKVESKEINEIQSEMQDDGQEEEIIQNLEKIQIARSKINEQYRNKYMSQQIEYLADIPDYNIKHEDQEQYKNNYAKSICQIFQRFQFKLINQIKKTKFVKEEDEISIKAYVSNFLPTTDYGIDQDIIIDDQQSALLLSSGHLDQHAELLYNAIIIMDNQQFLVKILFQHESQLFVAIAKSQKNKNIYETQLMKNFLTEQLEIPFEYILQNISTTLLILLTFQSNQLYFNTQSQLLSQIYSNYINSQQKEINKQYKEQNQQIIEQITEKINLAVYKKGNVNINYDYFRSTGILKITFNFIITHQIIATQIEQSQFQSKYIEDHLILLPDVKIISFFKVFTYSLTKLININEENHTHNFEDLRPNISFLLREKFIEKIQGMMLVKKMAEKFKMYKQLKQAKLFMHKFIINSSQNYTQVIYFLIKKNYSLLVKFKEISCLTPQGHLIEQSRTLKSKSRLREKEVEINLKEIFQNKQEFIDSFVKRQDKFDAERLDFIQITQYEQMKTIEYYRNLMTPIISLIQKNLQLQFSKFQPNFSLPINIKIMKSKTKKRRNYSISKDNQTNIQFPIMAIMAVEMLQNAYLKKVKSNWFQIKKKRIKEIEEKNKNIGVLLKRTYTLIMDENIQQYYLVNIYQKPGKSQGQLKYTFELISIQNKKKNNLNNVLRASYIQDQHDLIDIGTDQIYNQILKKIYIENQIIKFHDYVFSKQVFDQEEIQETEEKLQSEVRQEVGEILIDEECNQESIINVIYTDKHNIEKLNQKSQQNNTQTLQVNLSRAKQLYPQLNIKDHNTMKLIGSNLIKSVKLSDQGELLIDKGRIQSSFIKVIPNPNQSNLMSSQIPKSFRRQQNKPQSSNLLCKTTLTYGNIKYLIVISFVNKIISKILNQDRDSVFSEYEQILEIKGINFNCKDKEPIIWNLTADEGQILTHKNGITQIANALSKKIQVINDQFMFLCENESDLLQVKSDQNKNVIFFVESTIRPIQNRFKNRTLRKNYKEYRELMLNSQFDGTLIYKQITDFNSKGQCFIIAFLADDLKKIQLILWDVMDRLCQQKLEIQLKKYFTLYEEDKINCVKSFLNFVNIIQETGKVQFSNPKPERVQEYFEQEKTASLRPFSKIGSPLKSLKSSQQQKQHFFSDKEQIPSPSPMRLINTLQIDEIQEY